MKKDGIARQITRMRNVAKLTQPELAEILEVNVRTLARWEGGESSPKEGIPQEIARVCHKINPNATIFQDMAFTPTEDATWDISIADGLSDGLESTISDKPLAGHGGKEPTVSIGIHAFAGAGGPIELFEHEPIRIVDIPQRWKKPNINGLLVRGRSMEPTIMDGAVIGVDTGDKQIVAGEIYAIWLDYEGAVVKRLYTEPDGIRIVSDNPQFQDIQVKHADIGDNLILGRVRWVMQSY